VTFNETISFTFDTEELVFLRLLVVRDVSILKDEKLAVFCACVDRLYEGWRIVHLMDMKGKDCGASLLVRFEQQYQTTQRPWIKDKLSSMFGSK
jgi:phosphatidylinositol phospholipase C delta